MNGVLLDKNETTLIQFPGGLGGSCTILGSVTTIVDDAFDGSRLTSVTIPGSVTNIGDNALAFCNNLTAITVDTQNSFYSSGNGVLFDKGQTTLIRYPAGLSGNYVVPGSVTSIGNYAFAFCSNLTSVTIPDNVVNIGAYAFEYCGLNSVTIANGVSTIGNDAFNSCANLTNVTIPRSVTSVGQDAFSYCSGLTSIFFTGNAPATGWFPVFVFAFDNNATGYYLSGTIGWSSSLADLTTVLWNPGIQAGGGSFGVQNNYFGFNITNTANLTVVVEVCTNLASPVWVPLMTNTLANGVFFFSEPFQANSSGRFYGLGLP